MEVIFRANGYGTYAWEVRFDPSIEELPLHLFDQFENLRAELSLKRQQKQTPTTQAPTNPVEHELTKPPVVDRYHGGDEFVHDQVMAILNNEPRSTNELVTRLPGLSYMDVRAALLDLYAQGRIERTGSGGRGGFQYSLKTNT